MRAATSDELALLASAAYQTILIVEVQDGDLEYRDYRSVEGLNWIDGATISADVDQQVQQCTVTLKRQIGTVSLSQLRSDSSVNRNAINAFAPAIDVGRRIRVSTACVAVGATPGAGDSKVMHEGSIDTVDLGDALIRLTSRDDGGALVDAYFEQGYSLDYPDSPPTDIETVAQTMLDIGFLRLTHPVTLYTPTTPGEAITHFAFDVESAMDALHRLIQLIGWDVRYRWDESTSAFRLTLKDPDRAKTTPDATLAVNQIIKISTLRIVRTSVRNDVIIWWGPDTHRRRIEVQDLDSQTRFGVRRIVIQEASDSAIASDPRATTFGNIILSDTKDPSAEHAVELFYYWPAELHDLLRSRANGQYYDTDQDYAVVSIKHTLTPKSARTTILTRGSPAGSYRGWIRRSFSPGPAVDAGVQVLRISDTESSDGTTRAIAATFGGTTDSAMLYYRTVAITSSGDPYDFSDTATLPVDGGIPIIRRIVGGTAAFSVPQPKRGFFLAGRLVPYAGSQPGPSVRVTVNAAPPGINVGLHVTKTGATAAISATVAVGASDLPGTLAVIETAGGVDTTIFTVAVTNSATYASDGYPALGGRVLPMSTDAVSWRAVLTDVSGKAWNFGPVTALPSLVQATVVPSETSGTGTVTATITDDGGYLNPAATDALDGSKVGAVTFHVARLGVTSVFVPTAVPGSGTGGVYAFTFALDPLHPVQVSAFRHYTDGSTDSLGTWTFDSTKIADVVNATVANSGVTATATIDWDTDTKVGAGTARYSLDGGSTWVVGNVSSELQSQFSITRISTKQTAIIQAQSAIDSTWGDQATIEIDAYLSAAPSIVANYVRTNDTSGNIIWACTTGTVLLSIDGGTAATPSASPIAITLDGHTHTYQFVATRGGIDSSASVSLPALSTGSGLYSALDVQMYGVLADNKILLSWTPPDLSAAFDVYVNEDGAGYQLPVRTATGAVQYIYTLSGRALATCPGDGNFKVTFYVQAVYSGTLGLMSDRVSATFCYAGI